MSCYSVHDLEKPHQEFFVTSGPSHLHSPLGHSDESAHDHYIKPTANFTTEYEDAFRDPSPKVAKSDQMGSRAESWIELENALQKIIDCKFEVSVASAAMKHLRERRLSEGVEAACVHFNEMRKCSEISDHLRQLLDDFANKVAEFKK